MDKKVTPLMSIGTTGLRSEDGEITEEFLKMVDGGKAIPLYNEIRKNSPSVAAALRVIGMLIKQVKWRVEPADESEEAAIEAEDTESALEDMSHTFSDLISEILSMLWAGFSTFEIVYKLRKGPDQSDPTLRSRFDDGKYGWRKIAIRSQDSISKWGFDDDDGIQGFYQSTGGFGSEDIFIPIKKALLFRMDKEKNNPQGESLLRPAVIPYHYMKRIQEFEAVGIERNLAGMPVMEVPPELLSSTASPGVKQARQELERFITSVRNHDRWGALIPSETKSNGDPSGYKFRLVTPAGGNKVTDTDTVIKRYRTEILMLFMAQFLVMGTEKVGSYSLASSMTGLLSSAIGSILGEIKDVINQFLIPRRQELNGIPPELNPYMEHGDIEKPDLNALSGYIQQLMATGAVSPSDALERHLLAMGDLPQPPELDTSFEMLDDNTVDSVDNSMSGEQVKVVLEVNKALKDGVLDMDSAVNTIAAALGISVERAHGYLPKGGGTDMGPTAPPKTKAPKAVVPNNGVQTDEDEGM